MQVGEQRMCVRCVMDTTDPDITFDERGVCSHCRHFDGTIHQHWRPNEQGRAHLEGVMRQIREHSKGKRYDSIIGLSGGVDSSYLAVVAKGLGLNPLAVHVDTGWNRDVGISNIERIVKALSLDLVTHVVDWEEMRDLQVAYLRSGVENQDTPQDHAIFAALYRFAMSNGIRYVLSGSNYATESVLPIAWGHDAMDLRQLKAIHHQFGERPLRTYPTINFFQYRFYLPYVKRMRVVDILNYLPYDRRQAIETLEKDVGFRDYGKKHYESQFTKFFQGYYLPVKFGFDKRKAHLSSQILSGQLARDAALRELAAESYPQEELAADRAFVTKKLGLSEAEFSAIMAAPNRSWRDYPTSTRLRDALSRVKGTLRRLVSGQEANA